MIFEGKQILKDREMDTKPYTIKLTTKQKKLLEFLAKRRDMTLEELILELAEPEYRRQLEEWFIKFSDL